MEPAQVKGLIGAVGKHIAEAPAREKLFERLEAVDSRDAFREFLVNARLGLAEPSRSAFIDAVTDGNGWRDWLSQLQLAADTAWHEYRSPSS